MTEEIHFTRQCVPFVNECQSFVFKNQINYDLQYFNIYRRRLDKLRPDIAASARNLLGDDVIVQKLTDLNENEKCVVIGTIYKQQELKPSILKEIAQEANVMPQPVQSTKFTASDDKLILEDENLRVLLTGNISVDEFVTGVTVGLYGSVLESGSFDVAQVIFPQFAPSKCTTNSKFSWPGHEQDDAYVLLISGLSFGAKNSPEADALQVFRCSLLADWISGFFGQENELADKVVRVARIIIAGNSISEDLVDKNYGQIARYLARKINTPTVEAVQNLDDFLASIGISVEVDLMPGQHDPVNKMMPQQPFHRCMLPKTAQLCSTNRVTNPYASKIAGVSFLGTSGQNVDDIYRFCDEENRLKIASWNLKWKHLSPSSPDTLDCYPYTDDDPFLIYEMPDVYFVGNQPEFGCNRVSVNGNHSDILTITLPSFAQSGMCALLNLRTLLVEPLMFGTDSATLSLEDCSNIDEKLE